jgi:AcrR family transcriptional regulator
MTTSPPARTALLKAFSQLVLSRRYAEFDVGAIAARAGVGRSTFYYHFRAKDDLLVDNLRPMFVGFARLLVHGDGEDEALASIRHIWENRSAARRLFDGRTGRRLTEALAGEIAQALAVASSADRGLASLRAAQMAAATMGVLGAWVRNLAPASAEEVLGLIRSERRRF